MDAHTARIGVREPIPGVVYPPPSRLARYVEDNVLPVRSLADEMRASFARNAARLALAGPQGDVTYAELDEITDRLAVALLRLGARPLDRVMFQIPNCNEAIYAIVACIKAQLIPVCTLAAHRELEIGDGDVGAVVGAALDLVDDARHRPHRLDRVEPRRGLARQHQRELLRAVARDAGAHLILAGSGDPAERVALHSEARALGVVDRLHDLALLPAEELRVVYWATDLVASLWSPDGLSQTMLEALAAGAVVVASDLPGNRDWITPGENGLLVDPRDEAALAHIIRRTTDARELGASFAERNRSMLAERADRTVNLARWVREVEEMR